MTRHMTKFITSRQFVAAFLLVGALAVTSGCVGRAQQPDPGPMGSTATGSDADLPNHNSQSLPIDKP